MSVEKRFTKEDFAMKTRNEAVEACLQLGMCYEDYPFHDSNWTVMRHNGTQKSFAMIYYRNGFMCINLKATPDDCVLLRHMFSSVEAAYHMNKKHWITLRLDGDMADDQILKLIEDSYTLTLK